MLNFHNLRISRHAVTQMAERLVEIEDLADVLQHPAIVEPHDGKRRFVGRSGLVAVVAGDDENPVVVTVLLRGADPWDDDEARRRFER